MNLRLTKDLKKEEEKKKHGCKAEDEEGECRVLIALKALIESGDDSCDSRYTNTELLALCNP